MKEKVVAEVIKSQCQHYQVGDKIIVNGPLLDKKNSANVCVTALLSFYPFVFAMRKGVTAEQFGFEKMEVQCPDYCAPVVFELKTE